MISGYHFLVSLPNNKNESKWSFLVLLKFVLSLGIKGRYGMLFDTMEMIKCYTAAGHIYAHTDTYSSPLPHTFAAVNSNMGVSLTYTKKGLCNTQETYSFMYPSPQRVACCHLTKSSLFYLEKRIQLTPVFLPGESHGQRRTWWVIVHGVAKSRTRLSDFHSFTHSLFYE